jgi:FkbM family methyltransferase
MHENARAKEQLLAEINKDVPKGVNWKAGARTYVEEAFKGVGQGRAGLETYFYTKPMCVLSSDPQHAAPELAECVQYLNNFINTIKLLNLAGGSMILDVASGPGWMSHYFRKFGYKTFGFDVSSDFVNYARKRLRRDPDLAHLSDDEINNSFAVHDIEHEPLPEQHAGQYDAIILESCLHHFFDPASALAHLATALKPTGIVVIIEGENRSGEIKSEYMDVMRQYDTLERPYFRDHLHKALILAGLPAFEIVGEVNGFYSLNDPIFANQSAILAQTANAKNLTVCAKSNEALYQIFPFLKQAKEGAQPIQARNFSCHSPPNLVEGSGPLATYVPAPEQRSLSSVKSILRLLLRPLKLIVRPIARYVRQYFLGDIEASIHLLQGLQTGVLHQIETLHAQTGLEALIQDQSQRLDNSRELIQSLHSKVDDLGLRSRGLVRIDDSTFAMRTYDGFVFIPRSDHLLLLHLLDTGPAGLEPGIRRVLTRLLTPGMTFIDVGAHIGLLTLTGARAVGGTGRVLAIEPGPAAFEALSRTIAVSGLAANINAKRQAVGARRERRTFYIRSVLGHSSFMPRTLSEAAIEEIEIDVLPLDDMVQEGERVDVVKIDVEGAELAVLAGMKRIIAENPHIVIVAEYGPSHLDATAVSPEAWFASFHDHGFEGFLIEETTVRCRPVHFHELIDVESVNILFASRDSPALSRVFQ